MIELIYFSLAAFLLCLAVFDLYVGVSNDAVNFLQSAVGAKVAKLRTIMIFASAGVLIGAAMSQGMMDVARHGIIVPAYYSLNEVMTLFMAVMVTDILVLGAFNSLGMPTSTTVSMVFELLGGAVILAFIKMTGNPDFQMGQLINTDKALQVIIAIFVSVAIAFVFGTVVQWIARLAFTFNFKRQESKVIALFGGLGFTTLAYFIFLKGLGSSPYISEDIRLWIDENIMLVIAIVFVATAFLSQVLYWLHISVLRLIVLFGTFALAMAFAGNDLVNFIGVPMAGLDIVTDYAANGNGASPEEFAATILSNSASSPVAYLFIAGLIMVVAITTSKKAQKVVQTSVDLSRQSEGDEMFGSSRTARSLVRVSYNSAEWLHARLIKLPYAKQVGQWIDSRFSPAENAEGNEAAFDVVRAAVNLVLAALLITVGTGLKLPLSTTYVTFMVAMGSSLADRAWSRESAVFRITGVISVIGGWFLTAGVAFTACAMVCAAMFYGGLIVKVIAIVLVVFVLFRKSRKSASETLHRKADENFKLMMRTTDRMLVWELMQRHLVSTHTFAADEALQQYTAIVDGFTQNKVSPMRNTRNILKKTRQRLKQFRRQELLAMDRCPIEYVAENNTWYHVAINASMQYTYCLVRMWEPIFEHVDNNFTPLPDELVAEYRQVSEQVTALMTSTRQCIASMDFSNYRNILEEADELKNQLSVLRRQQIKRIQDSNNSKNLQIYLVYLNLLQETQQFLSNMRHQLRATHKFIDGNYSKP